jgi:small subunit ribosomal protein S16
MVRIRLSRRGRKKLALFDVIIADSRSPRDGRFIEKIGTYNPNTNPATIKIDDEKAFKWLMNGAQPSETVKAMLSYRGILFRKHLQIGVNKGAITQEQADTRLNEWKETKENKIQGKLENLSKLKSDDKKTRLEAETKIKEARAEAIAKRNAPPVVEVPVEETIVEAASAENEEVETAVDENVTNMDNAVTNNEETAQPEA